MTALARMQLGAPGIYPYPEGGLRTLTGVRLDLCAFAGVSPRGPARVPVAGDEVGGKFWRDDLPWVEPERPRRRTVAVLIESFDEYLRVFGGFEGPGRLPYAVAAFFENGGRRALVARMVHDYGPGDARNEAGVARARLTGLKADVGLRARNEGSWGAAMSAALTFATRPLELTWEPAGLRLGPGVGLSPGALLRASYGDGTRELRFIAQLVAVPDGEMPAHKTLAVPDSPLPAGAVGFELVEADLTLDDGAGRVERHAGLGLRLGHPRWLAQVLCEASELAWPEPDWALGQVEPSGADLTAPPLARFDQVPDLKDRWEDLVPEDFFDPDWSPESGEPGSGVCCFANHRDGGGIGALRPAAVLAPDLYSPRPLAVSLPVVSPVTLAGPVFATCVPVGEAPVPEQVQEPVANDLPGLHLDPVLDLDKILDLQRALIGFAESLGDLVALIDVPPGLDPSRIRRWRGGLASSYAAAYHPWLQVSRRDDGRDLLVDLPPSAAAAGIVADRELAFGVPHGPANRIAAGVVGVLSALSPDRHGEFHQAGINCFLRERDGIRLTGARTLAADPAYRQLSVRRLMILLRRVLLTQMQWAVFEPNGPALWREVRMLLQTYLRELYRRGAFRGATEADAFFVRCDAGLNPPYERDSGRLVAEVGVAPAEPLEFIVLRLARAGDGTLSLTE